MRHDRAAGQPLSKTLNQQQAILDNFEGRDKALMRFLNAIDRRPTVVHPMSTNAPRQDPARRAERPALGLAASDFSPLLSRDPARAAEAAQFLSSRAAALEAETIASSPWESPTATDAASAGSCGTTMRGESERARMEGNARAAGELFSKIRDPARAAEAAQFLSSRAAALEAETIASSSTATDAALTSLLNMFLSSTLPTISPSNAAAGEAAKPMNFFKKSPPPRDGGKRDAVVQSTPLRAAESAPSPTSESPKLWFATSPVLSPPQAAGRQKHLPSDNATASLILRPRVGGVGETQVLPPAAMPSRQLFVSQTTGGRRSPRETPLAELERCEQAQLERATMENRDGVEMQRKLFRANALAREMTQTVTRAQNSVQEAIALAMLGLPSTQQVALSATHQSISPNTRLHAWEIFLQHQDNNKSATQREPAYDQLSPARPGSAGPTPLPAGCPFYESPPLGGGTQNRLRHVHETHNGSVCISQNGPRHVHVTRNGSVCISQPPLHQAEHHRVLPVNDGRPLLNTPRRDELSPLATGDDARDRFGISRWPMEAIRAHPSAPDPEWIHGLSQPLQLYARRRPVESRREAAASRTVPSGSLTVDSPLALVMMWKDAIESNEVPLSSGEKAELKFEGWTQDASAKEAAAAAASAASAGVKQLAEASAAAAQLTSAVSAQSTSAPAAIKPPPCPPMALPPKVPPLPPTRSRANVLGNIGNVTEKQGHDNAEQQRLHDGAADAMFPTPLPPMAPATMAKPPPRPPSALPPKVPPLPPLASRANVLANIEKEKQGAPAMPPLPTPSSAPAAMTNPPPPPPMAPPSSAIIRRAVPKVKKKKKKKKKKKNGGEEEGLPMQLPPRPPNAPLSFIKEELLLMKHPPRPPSALPPKVPPLPPSRSRANVLADNAARVPPLPPPAHAPAATTNPPRSFPRGSQLSRRSTPPGRSQRATPPGRSQRTTPSGRRTRRMSIFGHDSSHVSSSTFGETLRKAGRKEVIVTLNNHGPLGLELITTYVKPTATAAPRVVIDVVAVVPGSKSQELGVHADDWLEEIGTTHIDLLGDDADHSGKISLTELSALLNSIRAIAPHGTAREHTAKELMDMYDKDHSHFLEPKELVNLVNEELLDTITAIMSAEVCHSICYYYPTSLILLLLPLPNSLLLYFVLQHSDRSRLCSREGRRRQMPEGK